MHQAFEAEKSFDVNHMIEIYANREGSVTAVSVTESVTVTAGTFTGCHHYYMAYAGDDAEFTNEIWFKAGIGFVQRFSGYNTSQERQRLESKLKAYSVQ